MEESTIFSRAFGGFLADQTHYCFERKPWSWLSVQRIIHVRYTSVGAEEIFGSTGKSLDRHQRLQLDKGLFISWSCDIDRGDERI